MQTALEERKKIETEYQCAAREFRQELDVAKRAAVSLYCIIVFTGLAGLRLI